MKRTYPIGVAVLVSMLIFASNAAIAQNSTDWTYLYDIAHTGVAADPIDTPLSMSWRYVTGESVRLSRRLRLDRIGSISHTVANSTQSIAPRVRRAGPTDTQN